MKLKFFLFLFFFFFSKVSAQKTWDGGALTNNWGDGANWNPDGVPDATDALQIGGGYSILVNVDANCASITFLSSSPNTSITLNPGVTLNVTGNLVFSNPGAASTSQTFNVADGNLNCSGISLANTTNGSSRTNNLLLNSGIITVANDITIAGAANENFVSVSGTGTLNIGGTFTAGATFTPGNGTVNFNGAGNQTIPAYAFHHLSTSTGGIKTLSANTVANGIFFIGASSSFNPNTFNFSVSGNTTITGTFTDANAGGTTNFQDVDLSGGIINGAATGIININGNLALPTADATIGRAALTVTGTLDVPSGRVLTFSDPNGAKVFNGDVTIDGTWNNTGNSAITFGGNLTVNNTATFAAGTGIHTFSGASKSIGGTLGSLSFPAVVVTGSLTNNIACTLTGLSGAGSWAQAENSALNISGALTVTTLSATATGNTVNYNGAGAQSIAAYTFYNLQLTGGNTKTLTGNAIVNNDFLCAALTTCNPNTFNLAVSGATIIQGIFGDGNVAGTTNFQNIDLSGGTISGAANGIVNINGNLTLPTADANIGRAALTVTGTLNVPSGRTLIISDINGAKVFNGDITIDGTWNNSGNSAITFGGNLTVNNTATFTPGAGIHTFSGASKSIGGTLGNLSFPAVVVTGSLTNNITCSLTGLSGAGSWTQAENSTLNVSGALTVTTLSATAIGNIVNYNGAGAQSITAYTFYNLQLTGGNTKTLTGNVIVDNDFIIAPLIICNPNTFDLTVTGNSTIQGTFADGAIAGTTNLQNVDLSGGTINGGANGVININGDIILPTADAIIGRAEITVTGTLNIPSGNTLTISNANGVKLFNGDVTVDGTWNNTGNSAITFGGNLTVNNTASFTAGTGIHTFSGASKSIGGTLGNLFFPAVVVPGSLTNNITCTLTSLNGAGSWTQAENSTLNISGALTVTTLSATATGNIVNFNGAGAQNIFTTDYFNLYVSGGNIKTQLNNLSILNNLNVAPGITFNIGTIGTTLSIGGNAQIDGILLFNTTTTKNVTITGNLSGTGTINKSGGNLPHILNLNGSLNNIGTLVNGTGASVINFQRTDDQSVFSSNAYRVLNINGSGIKMMSGDITATGAITVSGGTLNLNSHVLTTLLDITIDAGAELFVNSTARLLVSNNRTITNNGTFSVIGTSGNNAEVSINGAGNYFFNQPGATSVLQASHYSFGNLNNGLNITAGSVNSTYNLSNGSFSNGIGNQYINLTGISLPAFPDITNVTFNTGPVFNISRTSGTGSLNLTDAAGALSGENHDNDNGNPGTLINWNNPASTYYSAGNVSAGLLTSWTRNADGTGANPSSITNGLVTLIVQDGHTVTVDNNGDIDVLRLQIGQGTSGTFRIGSNATQQTVTVRELLDVRPGATLNAGSQGSPSHRLLIYGNINNDGTFNLKPSSSVVNTEIFGNTIIQGNVSPAFNDITFKTGCNSVPSVELDINGNVFFENASVFNDNGLSHHVAGNWSVTGTGAYTASGTIVFDGLVNTINDNPSALSVSFNNITFNGGVAGTIQENIVVNGDFLIANNTFVSVANNSVTLNGDFTVEVNSTYSHTTNTTNFSGTDAQNIDLSGNATFYNLYFSNGGINSKSIFGNITASNLVYIYDGATVDGSGDHTISNGLRVDGVCNWAGSVTLKGGNLYTNNASNSLTLGTAVLNIDGNIQLTYGAPAISVQANVNNDVNILSGYLVLNNNTSLIGQPSGTFKVSAGNLYVRGADNYPSGFGSFNHAVASWVIYDAAMDQIVRGGITYGNLQLGGGIFNKTADGILDVNGTLDLNGGITLLLQNFSHTFAGDVLNGTNSTINGSSASVAFDAADANQTIQVSGTGSYSFNNLAFTLSGATATRTKTFDAGSAVSIAGGNLNLANSGGSAAIQLILDLNNVGIGGSPVNFNINEYCQINTDHPDFGASVMDNFTGTKTLHENSTVYYSLNGAQLIADGFSYGNLLFYGGNKTARGVLDINGNIAQAGGTPVFYDNGFTHTISGNWLLNNGAWYTQASATGTIIFDGINQDINGVNFNNIIIANSGTANVVNNINVYGNITVNAGGIIDLSTRNLNLSGNFLVLGNGLFTQSTGTTTFNGASNQTITSNENSYFGLFVIDKPNPAGSQTVTALSELHFANNFTLTQNAGVFDISNRSIYFGGRLYVEANNVEPGATFISTGSNTIFDGTDAQFIRNSNINPLVFNHIRFTGAGSKSIDIAGAGSQSMIVNGNFTIDGSTVIAGGWGNGGMNIYVRGNWNNSGTFSHNNARTVYFDGATQTISATQFWNVDFRGTNQKILLGNISVNSHLTITTDTLNANNNNITLDGNWINTAASAVFLPGTGTVIFNGGDATVFTGTTAGPAAGKSFYNVEINKNAGTAILGGDFDVNNNLDINSGNLQTNAYSIWLAGDFNIFGGAFNQNNNASILTLDAIGGNKIFNANSGILRGIVVNAPGAVYLAQSDFTITNVDFTMTNGEFALNGNQMNVNGNNRAIRVTGGTFNVDSASVIEFTANTQLIDITGGTFKLVGSAALPATLNRTVGTYSINQSGGTIHAQNYLVRNGNFFITGGAIDATDNFSNGAFAGGAGNAYLTLTGMNFTDFSVENVIFNSGPLYNISRTSGAGVITLEDASGSLAGENYDQDNADPGSLVLWTFPAGFFWDGGAGTENWHDANNWSGNTVPSDTNIVYLNHNFVAGPYTVRVQSDHVTVQRIIMDAQGGNAISLVQENGYDVDIYEHLQIGSSCTYSLSDNSTVLNVGKNWTNLGTFNHGNSTVNFNGTAGNYIISSGGTAAGKSFYNLVINAEGASYSLGNPTDIDNNLTITKGDFNLASGNYDITVGGNWLIDQVSGGAFDANTADVTFDGASQTITNGTFYNVITAGSDTKTFLSGIDINADFTIGAGTTVAGGENSIYIGDDFINNGFFSQTGLGTIIFDGTGAQDIQGSSPTSFNNISFLNAGGKTFFNSATVDGTFTINNNSGLVNLDTYTIDGTGAANDFYNFGTLEVRGANNFPQNFENILMVNTSNVIYRADIDQTVYPTTYGSLTLRRLSAGNALKTAAGNMDITGNLNMNNDNNTIFNVAANNSYIRLTGNLNFNAGCDIIWGTGTSTLEHVGGDWNIDADLDSFNILILGGTGDKYTQGDLLIGGNLTIKSNVDLFMYQNGNRALFHTVTGLASKSLTLENGARLFCATPSATGSAIPTGFGNYNFHDNSTYYLYSPNAVDQTLYTGSLIHYGNLILIGTKNVTMDGIADLDVNGEFNTQYSTLFDNGRNIKVAGANIYLNYYTPSSPAISFTLDGLQNQYLRGDLENNLDFGAVNYTGSGTKTIGDGNDAITINGNLLINPSVTLSSNRNITFNGLTWTNNGVFTHSANTLTFNGAADQVINSGPVNAANHFSNIAFLNTTLKSFITNGADINGSFTINDGTVNLGNQSHFIAGQILNNAGGILISANSNLTFDGGNQNINTPAFTVNNVTISGTGTKRLFSDWSINGDLLINAGTVLNTSDNVIPTYYNINIKGNWTNLGTYTNNTSSVTFNGSASPVNITGGGSNFYTVVFNPSAGVMYNLLSPVTRFSRSMNIGVDATLNLNSQTLILGSNTGAGKLFTVDGALAVNENAFLLFNNQGSQSVMNVSGSLRVLGSSFSSMATISREIAGVTGLETQINILPGGTFAANNYLIEYLQDAGMNLQPGSVLDATNNMSNGAWSNIRNAANVRYLTLESDYAGGTIKNVTFNFAGTPVQGTHFNVQRELAATTITFDTCGGNLGSYKYEDDDEATVSATTGLLRWPAITESNWTGAVNNDWHLAANWDNGVPTNLIDAIIPDRPNDPIISNGDADCKNLTITNGTLILDNNNNLTTAGDITIGTGTSLAILSVNTPTGSIYAGGLWNRGVNGIFLHGNSTVVFNSASGSATIVPRTSPFYNVVFNNSLTTFYLSGTPINIVGKFEVLNGTVTPTTNNYIYNIGGDFNITGGTFTPVLGAVTAGTVILNGSADQHITNGLFHHLQVSGSGNKEFNNATSISGNTVINSTMVAAAGCNIDFNGNVTISAGGTFNDGNENHTFAGQDWRGTGIYTGGGSVTFDRTIGNHFIYKSTFNNLNIDCAGRILYISDSVTVKNNMEIRQGINYVNLQTNLITNSSGTGTFTMEDNTRMYVYGNDNFPKSFATYGLSTTSIVYYYGSGDQNVEGVGYGALYLNNNNTKTLKGDITVAGQLLFNTSTLDVTTNNYTITLAGAWNNNSTGNFICRAGEVIFNGTGNQAITFGGLNLNRFYNLTLNKPSGYAYANNNTTNDFIVENNLQVSGGQFHANGRLIFTGGNMLATGTGQFYNNTGTYILNKTSGSASIRVNNSSLLNLIINSSGSANYTVLDDITITGDLNVTSGTFNGNGMGIISGNGAGDVVNISGTYIAGPGGSLGLGDGTTLNVDVAGRIELVGTPSQIARVTNNTSGGRYNFIVNGTIAAQYYMFEYMSSAGIYLSGSSVIDAVHHFSNGTFTRGANSGQLFRIENNQSFTDPNYIANVSFPLNPGGSASNVTKITESTGTIEFYNSTGVFAGENYDNDPNNIINWTGPVTLTWNGSISTDWNDSLNWTANYGPPIVPTGIESVIIATATNQPVLTTFGAITGNLTINNGASLTINTPNDGGASDLDVNGDITINGTLRLMTSGDYVNVEGSWVKAATGTVILNGNVTFDGSGGSKVINNRGIAFNNLTIGGTSQYQLGWNTTVNNDLAILTGATFDVSPANYSLNIRGDWANNGTFMPNLGKVTFDASSGINTIHCGSSAFNDIDMNAPGVSYQLTDDLTVSRNFNIITGTLEINGNSLNTGDGTGVDNLTISGTLNVGSDGIINMGNNARLNVNSGGILNLVGIDISNRATITAPGTSRYSFDVNSGGIIDARFYSVSNTDADGLYIHSGATTGQVNNLSDGVYSNGFPVSGSYLKIEHEPVWGDDTIKNVTFNSGPLYNVSRTAGTTVFYFQDATGILGTYEYENDMGAPDPSSGLLHWPLLNTYIWTGAIDSDWHKPGNWSGGNVPDNTKNAIIPSAVTNFPEISTNIAQAKNITIYPGAFLTISRDLNITEDLIYDGTITATSNPVITIGENWTDNNGTFNPGNSTVIMASSSGTKDIQITTGSFYNLEIDGAGASYQLIRNMVIQNDFSITAGSFDMNGFSVSIGGSFINSAVFNAGNQTVTFNGNSGNHVIDAGTSAFYNLTINSASGLASYRLNDDIDIANNFTLSRGTFDLSPDVGVTNYNLSVENRVSISGGTLFGRDGQIEAGENWIINGSGMFNCGTSSVSFTSNSGTRTIAPRGSAFYDFSLNGNASFRLSGNLDVNNDLAISSGILDVATSPSYNINIAGDWINNATFVPRTGTVIFDGINQTITKTLDETFYNVTGNCNSLLLNTGVNITNSFNLVSGNITTQANTIVLGTSTSNIGSLSYTSGSIIGQFERWLNSVETDYLFPVGITGNPNVATVRFVSNLTPGSLLAAFASSTPGIAGLPVTDNGMPVDNVFTDGYWRFTSKNSLASADYNLAVNGNGFTSHTIDTATRVLKRINGGNWIVQGTHSEATGNVCRRIGLNGISATTTDFCLGIISCTGGIIGDIDTICEASDVLPFVNIMSPTGGSGYSYTWQFTTVIAATPGDANWTDIAGSNSLTFDYGTISTPTKFVRKTNSTGCPITYSNTIKIETYRRPVLGPLHHKPN